MSAGIDMAQEYGMHSRNCSRRHTKTIGTSPARAIEFVKVDAARELLVATNQNIKNVVAHCGFQDDERMRSAFLRHVETSPSQYRKQFSYIEAGSGITG